jgi:hypothetical protein
VSVTKSKQCTVHKGHGGLKMESEVVAANNKKKLIIANFYFS